MRKNYNTQLPKFLFESRTTQETAKDIDEATNKSTDLTTKIQNKKTTIGYHQAIVSSDRSS